MPDTEILDHLLAALAARDRPRLTALLDPGVTLRALLPRRTVELTGADAVADEMLGWFADVPRIEATSSVVTQVGGALHLALCWDLRGLEPDRVVEQHAYCAVTARRVVDIRLVCSGFRRPAVAVDALGDGCATLTPRLRTALAELAPGDVVGVLTDDPTADDDLGAWSRLTGNAVVAVEPEPSGARYIIRRKP